MKAKKFLLVAGLAIVMMFTATACGPKGPTDEEVITESLNQEFAQYANPSDERIAELAKGFAFDDEGEGTQGEGTQGEGTSNIDANALAKSLLSGFDYKIESVKVDGSNATATLTVTGKSLKAFTKSLEEAQNALQSEINAAFEAYANDPSLPMPTKEGIMQNFATKMQQVSESTPMVDETIELKFKLEGNTWVPVGNEEVFKTVDNVVLNGDAS